MVVKIYVQHKYTIHLWFYARALWLCPEACPQVGCYSARQDEISNSSPTVLVIGP